MRLIINTYPPHADTWKQYQYLLIIFSHNTWTMMSLPQTIYMENVTALSQSQNSLENNYFSVNFQNLKFCWKLRLRGINCCVFPTRAIRSILNCEGVFLRAKSLLTCLVPHMICLFIYSEKGVLLRRSHLWHSYQRLTI